MSKEKDLRIKYMERSVIDPDRQKTKPGIIDSKEKGYYDEEEAALMVKYRTETEDEALMRRVSRDAREFQSKYRGCSQCTLYALVKNLQPGGVVDPWQVLPGMTALCVGVAGKLTGTCGALLGPLYAIGMEFGRKDFMEPGGPREDGPSNFQACMQLANELFERFKEDMGTTVCCEIQEKNFGLAFDPVGNPQVQKMAEDGTLFDTWATHACRVVQKGAELAAEIILRERRGRTVAGDKFGARD